MQISSIDSTSFQAQIINGVEKLVEGRYLRNQICDEAKNVDLTKAFEKWM